MARNDVPSAVVPTVEVSSDGSTPSASANPGSGKRSKLGVLGPYLLFATLAWGIPSTTAPTLLQALLAQVDEARKVELTAIITTVGAVLTVIAAFTVGALSDRTRSRFGRRKPWIAGTALFGALCALLVLGAGNSVPLIFIGVLGFNMGLGSLVVALSALLPDHVPTDRLGRASSLIGVGSLLGLALGGVIASMFLTTPRVGLAFVPWLMVLAAAVGWFVIPKSSSLDRPKEKLNLTGLLAAMRPPADRDFWLVFAGRLAFLLALILVASYQLFILTDYYKADLTVAGQTIALAGVILAVGAAVSTAIFGWLSDKVQRRKPFIMAAGVVLALSFIILLTSREPSALLIYAAVASLAYGTYISVDQALMVEVLPSADESAKDLGFLTVANTAPGIVAPGLAALLVSVGSYPAVFIGGIVAAVLSILLILPIKRVR